MDKNLRPLVAELLGTFGVVFVATAAVCVEMAANKGGQPTGGLVGIALAYGLAYAVGLAATVHISGGFLNPAITLMLWVLKRMDGAKATGLIFVQLLGAAIAGGLTRFVFPEDVLIGAKLGAPHLNLVAFDQVGVSPGAWTWLSGIGMELGLTFILTIVVFATMIDPRAPRILGAWGNWLAGLWAGLAVAACTLAGFGLTGAAANPARWFGPLVWEYTIQALKAQQPGQDHLVYWVGAFLGALLAGGAYQALILPIEEEPALGAATSTPGKSSSAASSTLIRAKK
jgi:glycerol uptake facilitator-like aquaporin